MFITTSPKRKSLAVVTYLNVICLTSMLFILTGCKDDTGKKSLEKKQVEPLEKKLEEPVEKKLAEPVEHGTELNSSNINNSNGFIFEEWKQKNSTRYDVDKWKDDRPVYGKEITYAYQKNIGPLEIRVRMLDRARLQDSKVSTWIDSVLSDKSGLKINALEVMDVRSHGPAKNYLKTGDLIVKLGGEPIKSSPHVLRHINLGTRERAWLSLLTHTGTWLDLAEGKGVAEMTILRAPKTIISKLKNGKGKTRAWTTIKKLKVSRKSSKVSLSVNASDTTVLRFVGPDLLRDGNDWTVTAADGRNFPMRELLQIIKAPIGFLNEGLANHRDHCPPKKSMVKSIIEIPEGKWIISGSLSSKKAGECEIQQSRTVMPAEIKPYLQDISIPIDKIGSFGRNYDPNSDKAKNLSRILAWRLAKQQLEDGSWEGYATGTVATALLSTGNPDYNPHIKKAAYYLAKQPPSSHAMPMGLSLMFLGEYYLRTRDANIVPWIQAQLKVSRNNIYSDYSAPHYYNAPWYGADGWLGASSYLTLGWVLCDKGGLLTPKQQQTLDKMMERMQQLTSNGRVPYGRGGATFTQKQYEDMVIKPNPRYGRHGSACGTGPMVLAAKLTGESKTFLQRAEEIWGNPPYGRSRSGHCMLYYQFHWAAMTAANISSESHRMHLAAYLWEFTLSRSFDGMTVPFFSQYRYGNPFFGTASTLILLNAHKKNLASTCKTEYMPKKSKDYPIVNGLSCMYHQYIMDTWKLGELLLDDKATTSFKKAYTALQAIKVNDKLDVNIEAWSKHYAIPAITSLRNVKLNGKLSSNKLIDLLLGVRIEAATINENDSKKSKKSFNKINDFNLFLNVGTMMIKNGSLKFKKNTGIENSLFPITDVKVVVRDPSKKAFSKPVDIKLLDEHKNGLRFKYLLSKLPKYPFKWIPSQEGRFIVDVSYKLSGVPMKSRYEMSAMTDLYKYYMRPLLTIPIRATLLRDFRGEFSLLCKLKTGKVLNLENAYLSVWKKNIFTFDVAMAGSVCDLWISHGSMYAYRLKKAEPLKNKLTRMLPVAKAVDTDGNDMKWFFQGEKLRRLSLVEKPLVINVELAKPTAVGGIALDKNPKDMIKVRVEGEVNGEWVTLMNTSSRFHYLPALGKIKKMRVHLSKNMKLKAWVSTIQGIRFYSPEKSQ